MEAPKAGKACDEEVFHVIYREGNDLLIYPIVLHPPKAHFALKDSS